MQNATMEAAFEPLPSSIVEALSSIVADPTFNIRVIAGGIVGILIYTVVGMIMHHIFYRKVRAWLGGSGWGAGRHYSLCTSGRFCATFACSALQVCVPRGCSILAPRGLTPSLPPPQPQVPRNIFALVWHSDLALGLTSLAFGAPVIAGFTLAHEKWGIMKTYMDISEFGWGWWAASIPVYLLMFDFGFYFLHLVLHMEPIYSWSHANHHAFRPPTAWSGIAIDPLETIFSGLAPYLWPLFFVPFHLPTVCVALRGRMEGMGGRGGSGELRAATTRSRTPLPQLRHQHLPCRVGVHAPQRVPLEWRVAHDGPTCAQPAP